VRQIFYFGTEAEQEDGRAWMNSLLMASYNDMGTVPFWKGLELGKPFEGYRPSCLEPEVTDVIPKTEFPATDEMVQVANSQVAEVHALPEIDPPYSAVYHTWNEDPYGGGWHEWKADYRLDEVMCRMRKPVESEDIYIVGEAYSYGQGWVEGALDTAESMVEDFFGLKRPSWLQKDYALMPNPCPGCEDLDGCIEFEDPDGKILDSVTPDCLEPIEVS
jgi:monoamine oxidase